MPTAEKFKALGVGNGFTYCLQKVDVTDGTSYYIGSGQGTHWMTLGGVSNDNPTASKEQIKLSFINAMKLWWNMYSVQAGNLTASSQVTSVVGFADENQYGTLSGWPADSSAVDGSNGIGVMKQMDLENINQTIVALPHLRVSGNRLLAGNSERDGPNDGRLSLMRSRCSYGANFSIIKMYNGSTNDESNFVGYGVSDNVASAGADTRAEVRGAQSGVDVQININVSSLIRGDDFSGIDASSGHEVESKIYSCTLGGMPFVGRTFIEDRSEAGPSYAPGTITNALSANVLNGSATSSFYYSTTGGEDVYIAAGNGSLEASIQGIDFYTYAS